MSQLAVSVYKFKSTVFATYGVVSFLRLLILIQKAISTETPVVLSACFI